MLGIFEEQTCFLTGNVFHIKNFHFGCLDCTSPNVLLVCPLSFFLFLLKFALYMCINLTHSSFTIYFEIYVLPLVIPSKILATFTLFPLLCLKGNTMHDLYFCRRLPENSSLQTDWWDCECFCEYTNYCSEILSWAQNRELLCLPTRVLFLACLC